MKKFNYNWFDKLFFPGAEVLYSFLSFLCLFFFFFFFGTGEQYHSLPDNESPNWLNWYIFAVLGFIFFSLCGILKKWWGKRFLAIGTIILFFSFYSLQVKLFHLPNDKIYIALLSIFISSYCSTKLIKKSPIKSKLIWLLPFIVIIFYYLIGNVFIIQLCALISLIVLAIFETPKGQKHLKFYSSVGILIFYCFTTLTYFPYNPLLSLKKIKSISVSYRPRATSMVIEQDHKFIIVDGSSWSESSPIDTKFDCFKHISLYNNMAFVGFETDAFKEVECKAIMDLKSNLYPIILTDSCAYFASNVNVYRYLKEQEESENERNKLTAKIFYDFINIYQNNDSSDIKTLKKHQADLQNIFINATTDSLKFNNKEYKIEEILRNFSQNLSLGMLNALCSDLILNNDVNSALNVFSFQFFLTFFDSPIYNHINTTLNINLNKTYGSRTVKPSYQVTDKNLKRNDIFEEWNKIVSMSISFAELYILENQVDIKPELYSFAEKINPFIFNIYNRDNAIKLKESFENLIDSISSYSSTPTIKQYAITVQNFLYQCVLHNYLPDYSSFFLNRFNEITPMVPMNSLSSAAYDSISNLYSERFVQDISYTKDLLNPIDRIKLLLNENIQMQDSIQNQISKMGLDPAHEKMLKELLFKSAMSKPTH